MLCNVFFTASPFLIGRALWFSSRFTSEMPPELLARSYSLDIFMNANFIVSAVKEFTSQIKERAPKVRKLIINEQKLIIIN